jgi:hypothetical protein
VNRLFGHAPSEQYFANMRARFLIQMKHVSIINNFT